MVSVEARIHDAYHCASVASIRWLGYTTLKCTCHQAKIELALWVARKEIVFILRVLGSNLIVARPNERGGCSSVKRRFEKQVKERLRMRREAKNNLGCLIINNNIINGNPVHDHGDWIVSSQ